MRINMSRVVWEDWTVRDFVVELYPEIDLIMTGQSWHDPFKTKKEMSDYLKDAQPYYKKPIPEVNEYFAAKYGLK